MPMLEQRNSLTAKATAVLLYHLFTSLAPPSKSSPFKSLKFWFHTLLIRRCGRRSRSNSPQFKKNFSHFFLINIFTQNIFNGKWFTEISLCYNMKSILALRKESRSGSHVDLTLKLRSEWKSLSGVWLFATPWIVARQAPLSMGFPKQESWSWWPFPSPLMLELVL